MGKNAKTIILAMLLGSSLLMFGCATKTYQLYDSKAGKHMKLARLKVPDFIEVREFDGQPIGDFFEEYFHDGDREFRFAPGPHSVTVRYNEMWDIGGGDHETFKSNSITLSFRADPGGIYLVQAEEPEDLNVARNYEYSSNFKAWILDKGTGKKASH